MQSAASFMIKHNVKFESHKLMHYPVTNVETEPFPRIFASIHSLTTRLKTSSLTFSPVSALISVPNWIRVQRNRFT